MQFRLEHWFDTDVDGYLELLFGTDYPRVLVTHCPSIAHAEVLSIADSGDVADRLMLFRPVPGLYRVGPYRVDTTKAELRTRWQFDRRTGQGSFENTPNLPRAVRHMFANEGTFTLQADGDGVRRVMTGRVTVRFPIVGGLAERIISSAGVGLMEEEAEAVQHHLSASRRLAHAPATEAADPDSAT